MLIDAIRWLGHASFIIEYANKIIYIDPWEIISPKSADIVFITHNHFDHFSPEDLIKITTPKTQIIAPRGCEANIPKIAKLITVVPGDEKEVLGIKFKVVAAYNINKQFHPKSNSWVGYIIEMEGTNIYHSGDTDLIPEMDGLDIDIALLPIGGTYTMDAQEASEAARRLKAKIVIPMHYGKIIGSKEVVEVLKDNLSEDIELKVLPLSE